MTILITRHLFVFNQNVYLSFSWRSRLQLANKSTSLKHAAIDSNHVEWVNSNLCSYNDVYVHRSPVKKRWRVSGRILYLNDWGLSATHEALHINCFNPKIKNSPLKFRVFSYVPEVRKEFLQFFLSKGYCDLRSIISVIIISGLGPPTPVVIWYFFGPRIWSF